MRLVIKERSFKKIKENSNNVSDEELKIKLKPSIFLKLTLHKNIFESLQDFVFSGQAKSAIQSNIKIDKDADEITASIMDIIKRSSKIYDKLDLSVREYMPSLTINNKFAVQGHEGRARMLASWIKFGDTPVATKIISESKIDIVPSEFVGQYSKEKVYLDFQPNDVIRSAEGKKSINFKDYYSSMSDFIADATSIKRKFPDMGVNQFSNDMNSKYKFIVGGEEALLGWRIAPNGLRYPGLFSAPEGYDSKIESEDVTVKEK